MLLSSRGVRSSKKIQDLFELDCILVLNRGHGFLSRVEIRSYSFLPE